jgi:hypothetical protein
MTNVGLERTTYTIMVQWNLNLSFLKGVEKTNDECAKMINPENDLF